GPVDSVNADLRQEVCMRVFVRRARLGQTFTAMALALTVAVLPYGFPAAPRASAAQVMLAIDTPAEGATVVEPIVIEGWAVDLDSIGDAGIAEVLLFLDGTADQPGEQLGSAEMGLPRSDLAA